MWWWEGCFTACFCCQNNTDHYLKMQTVQKYIKVKVLHNPRGHQVWPNEYVNMDMVYVYDVYIYDVHASTCESVHVCHKWCKGQRTTVIFLYPHLPTFWRQGSLCCSSLCRPDSLVCEFPAIFLVSTHHLTLGALYYRHTHHDWLLHEFCGSRLKST